MKAKFLLLFCLSLVCSLPLSGQILLDDFDYAGANRKFRLFIPSNYTGNDSVPLVINMHGYGSEALQQEIYSGMINVADTAGFLLVHPDGISNAWNSGFTPPYNGGVNDVGFLSTLMDTLIARYNIDRTRIYATGMSNGGFMSFRLACDLESRVAAIASVTGTMTTLQLTNCVPDRPVPVMQIHGDNDATVAYYGDALSEPVDSVISYWRQVNNCTAPPVYDTLPDVVNEGSVIFTQYYGGCQDNTEVLHFKVSNGGHSWPGAPNIPQLGLTNQDINASVEIWHFFSRHVHPSPLWVGRESARELPVPQAGPNPFSDYLEIQGLQEEMDFQLIDVQGRMLRKGQVPAGEKLRLDTQDWPAGVYWLRYLQGNKAGSSRFVKAG